MMPPDSESNTPHPATLRGVADRMTNSPDEFTMNVGLLVDWIATQHEPPVTCQECRDRDRDQSFPCLSYESALSVGFAWLLKAVDER
jgi:hypothetical protein